METFKKLSVVAFALVLLSPAVAMAHPMGNFSINHYAKLVVGEKDIRVTYILDFAEIPSFQLFRGLSGAALATKVHGLASEWVHNLSLTVEGRPLTPDLIDAAVEVKPGLGGLSTIRTTLRLRSSWSADNAVVRFHDRNFQQRIGWKEIVVAAASPFGFPEGNPFSDDRSEALSRYPADLLATAPNVTEVSVRIAPGMAAPVSSATVVASSASVAVPASDRLSQILRTDALPLRLVLVGALVAFALGALHALSPGHGKTVVASFLVGAKGTARHAIFLGAVVTFTHTVGVFLLGLVVLFLSNTIVPERIYPWIGFVSGLMILGVGLNLFRQRLAHLTQDHEHGHLHEIPSQITFRNLLALGFSGGIVPCPSALVVLLSAVALHRVGTGLLFILAFSLGLATVLVAIGVLVVRASHLLSGFDSRRGLIRFVPVASAAIISVLGLAMSVQALAGTTITGGGVLLTGQAVAVLGLGLFLGLKHATDADHVVAVTTFVSQEQSLLRSCWIGAFWGVGHTLSLAAAGVLVIGLRLNIPEWLSQRLELGVAAMLVLLGANVVIRTVRDKQRSPSELHRHSHSHESLDDRHRHWHIHLPGLSNDHFGWAHAGLRPLLTGIVHGAAGSAALMLLVLSTIRSPIEAFLYILVFGLGSILGMLAISLLLAIPLHWARRRMTVHYKPVQLVAGLFSCVFGLFLAANIWTSL